MTMVMPKYLRALELRRWLPKFPSMASLSHRQTWSFPLTPLILLLPFLLFGSSKAQDPQVTYRTGTSEVRVSFFATDQNGRLLDKVTKQDFAVVDGGIVVRDFRSLVRANETALDIVALVDTSQSVAPRFRADLENVVQLVDAESSSASGVVSVIQFAGLQPAVLCSGDCGSTTAEQKIQAAKAQGPTPLYDALTYTAQFISEHRTAGARQVIILFSDGNDTISRASAREAFAAVAGTGALLYTVNLGGTSGQSPGASVLQQMAEATGGRSFSARDGTSNVLQSILADLRSAYVVSYALPSHDRGFHTLQILPKHNLNLRFHCRRGYFYEESR